MKLRCLLIDDEPPALKVLASYISSINGLEIAGQCRNAIEALTVLHQKTVDVIFLDIKMPRLLGTEFLKNLSHPPKVFLSPPTGNTLLMDLSWMQWIIS